MWGKWFLLFFSASLYVIPFWWSQSLWWLAFFFIMPLFYLTTYYDIGFKEGYVWGVLTFGLHTSGVMWGIYGMPHSTIYFWVIPLFCAVLYQGLFAACWFSCVQQSKKYFLPYGSLYLYSVVWVMLCFFYFYIIEHFCLLLFGRCEGYALMNPLLLYSECNVLLYRLMWLCGKNGALLLMICVHVVGGILTIRRAMHNLFLCVVCVSLFFCFCKSCFFREKKAPPWLSRCMVVQKPFFRCGSSLMTVRIFSETIRQLLLKHPEKDIIFMPESALYDERICTESQCQTFLSNARLQKKIHIIAGVTDYNDICCSNSCVWLYNGECKSQYYKRHAMLLTERVPDCFFSLYGKDFVPCVPSMNKKITCDCNDGFVCMPYICSELFFSEWPDCDDTTRLPIALLANDRWASSAYIKRLLYNCARFKALQWQRTIIYVSYRYASCFDQYGYEYEIL